MEAGSRAEAECLTFHQHVGLVLRLTIIVHYAGFAEVFLAGWFLVAGVFLLNCLMRQGGFLVDSLVVLVSLHALLHALLHTYHLLGMCSNLNKN